jgi:signal peptidase II
MAWITLSAHGKVCCKKVMTLLHQLKSNASGQPRPALKSAAVLAGVIFALDQAVKLLVQGFMAVHEVRSVIPGFFNLVHIHNRGAAFGLLNRSDISWQTPFFIAVTLLTILIIVYLIATTPRQDRLFLFGLSGILSGALGNLVDRIRMGYVIDYLDFFIGPYHWPAFNVADTAISLGAIALLISFYRKERHEPRAH